MNFTIPFSNLSKNDASIAGGKGASLGEMIQSGIPVPPGFVISAQTFEKFIEETDINVEIDNILHDVKPDVIHTVEDASAQIQSLIKNVEMPKDIASEILNEFNTLGAEYVAVRSSATAEDSASAAWAGQLDSFLNTTKDDVLEKVQFCWASLFTPRAIFYRFEKDLHLQKISVAVVVQKMVNSEKSGIAFSVHPVTEDRNQLIIEAGFGLGEAIVSGQITPDSYVVEKEPRRIVDTNVATQTRGLFRKDDGGNEWKELGEKGETQVLSEEDVFKLSEIILHIENHYGFPCDIEWAYENNTFYIVQSRPITTLTNDMTNDIESGNLQKESPMILLGAWNVMPLEAWRWFDAKAILKLESLTGVKIRVFTYVKDGLHYQCVFSDELHVLKEKYESNISDEDRISYIQDIYKSFYIDIEKLENYVKERDTVDVQKLTDQEIIDSIRNFADLWTSITTQIWYAVFLDIWYPMPEQEIETKKIAADARDRTGKLHELSNIPEHKLYTEAGKRVGLSFEDASFLFPEELIDCLNNRVDYQPEIEDRKKFCVTTNLEGLYNIYSGLEAQKLFDENNPPSIGTKALKELSGTIARKGKVTGIVRVIQKDEEFSLFREGEILVALQTMVHYLPIMKKASAILTEFGGLTSHAAIVSRELGKPCIVGIDNLLASLKNGDEVEVDADNGVIKILNTEHELHNTYNRTIKNVETEIEKNTLEKLLEKKWFKIVRRENSPLWESLIRVGATSDNRDFGFKNPMPHFFALDNDTFASVKEHQVFQKLFAEKSKNDANFLDHLFGHLEHDCRDLDKIIEDINTISLDKISDEDLLLEYKKFINQCLKILTYIWAPLGPEEWIMEHLTNRLSKEIDPIKNYKEIKEVLETLTQSEIPSFIQEREEAVLELAANLSENKKIENSYKKYAWIRDSSLKFEYEALSEFQDEIKNLSKENHSQKLKDLKEGRINLIQRKKDLIEKYNFNLEDIKYAQQVSKIPHWRLLRTEKIVEGFYLLQNFFTEISKRISSDNITLLYYWEIEALLKKEKVNIDRVKERRNGYGLLITDTDIYDIGRETAIEIKNKITSISENANIIKGSTACKGYVTAKVQLINSTKDIKKFVEGNVLVTAMTTPEFVPIMKKASAIITDEGGISCHAAIVSRELNIPCIIGTKISTQILKDGDEVEVDADKGIVTLLRKKEDSKYTMFNQDVDSSFLTLEMTWRGMRDPRITDQIGLEPVPAFESIIKGTTINTYGLGDGLAPYINRCSEKLLEENGLIEELKNKTIDTALTIRTLAIHNIKKIESFSDVELADLLEEVREAQSDCVVYGTVVALADAFGAISNKTTDIFKNRTGLKYPTHVYTAVLAQPEEESLTEQAYVDVQSGKKDDKELLEEYFWLEQGYIGRGLTADQLNDIKEHAKEVHKENGHPDKTEILAELNLTDQEKRLFSVASNLIFIKSLRADSRQFGHVLVNLAVDKIAHQLSVEPRYIEVLSTNELCRVLRGQSDLPTNLGERYESSIMIPNDKDDYDVLTSGEARRYLEKHLVHEEIVKTDVITGQVAQPGRVRGRVRLVFGPQHNGKVMEGDILVSVATSPQLLPAMKRANAFITDMGGVTSHAAIVARELKKPCIVGTKIATKILEDGMEVEVDADSGVINILE